MHLHAARICSRQRERRRSRRSGRRRWRQCCRLLLRLRLMVRLLDLHSYGCGRFLQPCFVVAFATVQLWGSRGCVWRVVSSTIGVQLQLYEKPSRHRMRLLRSAVPYKSCSKTQPRAGSSCCSLDAINPA